MVNRIIDSMFSKKMIRVILICVIAIATLAITQLGFAENEFQIPDDEPTQDATDIQVPTPLPGVPVQMNGEILFYVRDGIFDLTPIERAILIERRINDLATNPFYQDVEIVLAESDIGTELLAGDINILTVTDEDAKSYNMTRQEAAEFAAELIQSAINRSRATSSIEARISKILTIMAILVGLVIAYFILNILNIRFEKQIDIIQTEGHETGIYRSRYYRSGVWKRTLKSIVRTTKWILFFLLVVIGIPFLLELFPATAKLAEYFFSVLARPLSAGYAWLTANSNNFITIAIIAVVFYLINRFSRLIFSEIGSGNITISGFDPEWATFTSRIISFLLVVAGVIVAFPFIPGSDSPAFRGITVFLGALFTLSSTSAVTNIVAGIIQTYTGAFRNGDIVRIGEITGTVLEKRLITTRILTFKNEDVSIPNGVVLSSNVTNYSTLARQNELVLYSTVTIGYDVPWQTVHQLLISAAELTTDILLTPEPFVLQTSLNDFHISYQINCYTNNPNDMARIYSNLHSNIQDQFNRAGVEIMSPGFTAYRDGNESTIPKIYRESTGERKDLPGQFRE